ncbi:transmembrane protein, putative [Bodo saltans]|uniref:Transmembrane protein, putative n=1 Tax=Bodo saltans TaxID=75058 RepID=A0A0S4IN41_BODSA|nr:transmembrane protein, putative [Bodo saltans]|eukprot:CUE77197.1 transmembrane protein, putative [Bodo saltans]
MALRKKIAFQAMLMSKLGNPSTIEGNDEDNGLALNDAHSSNATVQNAAIGEELKKRFIGGGAAASNLDPLAASNMPPRPSILLPVSSEAAFISAGRPAEWRSSIPAVTELLCWVTQQSLVTPLDTAAFYQNACAQKQQSISNLDGSLVLPDVVSPTATPRAAATNHAKPATGAAQRSAPDQPTVATQIAELCFRGAATFVSDATQQQSSATSSAPSNATSGAASGRSGPPAPPPFPFSADSQADSLITSKSVQLLATHMSRLQELLHQQAPASSTDAKPLPTTKPSPQGAANRRASSAGGAQLQSPQSSAAAADRPRQLPRHECSTQSYVAVWDTTQNAAVIMWRERRGGKLLHRALTAVGHALRQALLPSTFVCPISLSCVFDGHVVSIVWLGSLCSTIPVPLLDEPSNSSPTSTLVAPALHIVSAILRPLHYNDELRQQRDQQQSSPTSAATTATGSIVNRQELLLAAYPGYSSRYWVLPSETLLNCMSDTVFRTEWLLPDFITYTANNLGATHSNAASPTAPRSSSSMPQSSQPPGGGGQLTSTQSNGSMLNIRIERLVDTLFGMALRTFPIPVVQRAGAFLRSIFHSQGVPLRELLEVRRLLMKRDVNPKLVLSVERVRKLQAEMCSLMAAEAVGRVLKHICLLPAHELLRDCMAPVCLPTATTTIATAAAVATDARIPPSISAAASKKLLMSLPSLKNIFASLSPPPVLDEDFLRSVLGAEFAAETSSSTTTLDSSLSAAAQRALRANLVVQLFERCPAFVSHVVAPRVVQKFPVRAEQTLATSIPLSSSNGAFSSSTNAVASSSVMTMKDIIGYLRHSLGVDFTPTTSPSSSVSVVAPAAPVVLTSDPTVPSTYPQPPQGVAVPPSRSPRQVHVLADTSASTAATMDGQFEVEPTPSSDAVPATKNASATTPILSASVTPRTSALIHAGGRPPSMTLPPSSSSTPHSTAASQNTFLTKLHLFSVQCVFLYGGVNATFTMPNFVVCSYADRTQALITDMQRCGGFATDAASGALASLSITVAAAGLLVGISLANTAEAFGLKAGAGAREMALRTVRNPSASAPPPVYSFLLTTTRIIRALFGTIKDQQGQGAAAAQAPPITTSSASGAPASILSTSNSSQFLSPRPPQHTAASGGVSDDAGITPTPSLSQQRLLNGSLLSASGGGGGGGNDDTNSTGSGSNNSFGTDGAAARRHSSVVVVPSSSTLSNVAPQVAWKQLQKLLLIPIELAYISLLKLLPMPTSTAATTTSGGSTNELRGIDKISVHPSDALWAQELIKRILQQGLPLPSELQRHSVQSDSNDPNVGGGSSTDQSKSFARRSFSLNDGASSSSGVFASSQSLGISTSVGNFSGPPNPNGTSTRSSSFAHGNPSSSTEPSSTVTTSVVTIEIASTTGAGEASATTPRQAAAPPPIPLGAPPSSDNHYGLPSASSHIKITVKKGSENDQQQASALSNSQRQALCRSWLQVLSLSLRSDDATQGQGGYQSWAPVSETSLRYLWYGLITLSTVADDNISDPSAPTSMQTGASIRRKSVVLSGTTKDAHPSSTVLQSEVVKISSEASSSAGSDAKLQQLLFGGQWDPLVEGPMIALCLAIVSQHCFPTKTSRGGAIASTAPSGGDVPSSNDLSMKSASVLSASATFSPQHGSRAASQHLFWDPTVTKSLAAHMLRMVLGSMFVSEEAATKKPSVPKASASAASSNSVAPESSFQATQLPAHWQRLTAMLLAVSTRGNHRQSDDTTENPAVTTTPVPYLALTAALVAASSTTTTTSLLPACCVQQILNSLHASSAPSYFKQSCTTSSAAPWGVETQLLPIMMAEQTEWFKSSLIPFLASGDGEATSDNAVVSPALKQVLLGLVTDVLGQHPSASKNLVAGVKSAATSSNSKNTGNATTSTTSSSVPLFCSAACKTKTTKALQVHYPAASVGTTAAATTSSRVKSEAISAVLFADDNDATPATPIAAPPPLTRVAESTVPQELMAQVKSLEEEVRQYFKQMTDENTTLEGDVASLQQQLDKKLAAQKQQELNDEQEFKAAKKVLDEQNLLVRSQLQLAQELVLLERNVVQRRIAEVKHTSLSSKHWYTSSAQ